MTNTKSTKHALIASILVLCLCFTMLVGTTFAWFTDSVTSAGNKIVAGSLKIDLELYKDGEYTSIKDSYEPIFNYDKWEPGYTQTAFLKVVNEGNLALKWQAVLKAENELSILADVIDVYVTTADASEEEISIESIKENWSNQGTLRNFITNFEQTKGVLYPSGSEDGASEAYLGIALHMQEEAGNEYKGLELGAFDIQILATQLNAEEDSFGNQYDANATYGTYIELNAGDDLLAALASAEAGMPVTIVLNGDVEYLTEGHHGENNITNASDITIIGNGNTITATGAGVTPIGDDKAPMTLKNVKIVDNSVSYNEGAWEFTYLEMGGSALSCDNVTFADEIQLSSNAIFTNCSFESNEESVYAVWVNSGSAKFANCTFAGYRGLKMHEDYSSEIAAVTVDGCTFENISKKPGLALGTLNADTTVSITNSTFINCQKGDQSLYIYETDTDVTTFNFTEKNNSVVNGEIVKIGTAE